MEFLFARLGQGAGSNGWLAANDIPVDDWWPLGQSSPKWSSSADFIIARTHRSWSFKVKFYIV